MKKRKEVAALVLALMIFISMLYSLPLVSAVYTVEEHYMPPEPDDSEPICALKTRTDGYFYVPYVATDLLKIELLFDDSGIEGDQTGGTSPYSNIAEWPNGIVDMKDIYFVQLGFGKDEGYEGWNYMWDWIPDRRCDMKDVYGVILNYMNSGDYIYNLTGVKVTFNTGGELSPDNDGFVVIPQGATNFTVKRNGNPIGAMVIFYGPREPPIAYSTTFEFSVPDDGGLEVWYYVLVRMYVPSELAGNQFYLFPDQVDDWIRNVKMNRQLKYSGGHPACQPPASVNLGVLGQGYHLLEFEFGEQWAYGILRFHIATASGQYAWLSRFRTYVPNYSPIDLYEYAVKTYTYFPPADYYYLGGYADDYISEVYLGVGCIYHDWEWNSQSGTGDIFSWDFMYPLETLSGWSDVKLTYGNKKDGVLDFQYLSRTSQQDRIGNPKFWTRIYPPSSSALTLYDGIAFAGSKWDSIPGSRQHFTAGIRVLANATDTNTFYPISQEAEVSLFLDVPGPPWNKNSYQDIGVYINVTYTYYIEGSLIYGMPIWFEPYLISVNMPTQGYMLYMPTPSIIYSTQSTTSFITPEWKIAGDILGRVVAAIYGYAIGGWPGVILGAIGMGANAVFWNYAFADQQILNSTAEYYGPPTSRNYTMNAFKTTQDQIPLSPVVASVCSAYFFRVWAFSSTYTGGVTVDLHGRLWLPFFYKNPPPGSPNWYGTWLPIEIEICTVFPVFIED